MTDTTFPHLSAAMPPDPPSNFWVELRDLINRYLPTDPNFGPVFYHYRGGRLGVWIRPSRFGLRAGLGPLWLEEPCPVKPATKRTAK